MIQKASATAIIGVVVIAMAMFVGVQYSDRQSREVAIKRNAAMIELLPRLPFERGQALTASEKSSALDLSMVENRVLLSPGRAAPYQQQEFSQAYTAYANPQQDKPKDKFKERQRQRDATAAGEAAFMSMRGRYAEMAPKYAITQVSLTLSHYDFNRQSFLVQPHGGYAGKFPIDLFRNIAEPRLVKGTGSSSLERVVSSTRAYQVTGRWWPVAESTAKKIDRARVLVYAWVYWDISQSSYSGRDLMVHCIQIDLYADPELSIPVGESGCESMNVKIKV